MQRPAAESNERRLSPDAAAAIAKGMLEKPLYRSDVLKAIDKSALLEHANNRNWGQILTALGKEKDSELLKKVGTEVLKIALTYGAHGAITSLLELDKNNVLDGALKIQLTADRLRAIYDEVDVEVNTILEVCKSNVPILIDALPNFLRTMDRTNPDERTRTLIRKARLAISDIFLRARIVLSGNLVEVLTQKTEITDDSNDEDERFVTSVLERNPGGLATIASKTLALALEPPTPSDTYHDTITFELKEAYNATVPTDLQR